MSKVNSIGDYQLSTKVIKMAGGINEHQPSLEMAPGNLIECVNYMIKEGSGGGYVSTEGYERIDGTGKSSDILSTVLKIQGDNEVPFTYTVLSGDVILGATGSATAIGEGNIVGPYQGVEITLTVDSFIIGEDIYINAQLIGTFHGIAEEAPSEAHHTLYDQKRASVSPVPGELNVLGLYHFHDNVLAFRKKVGLLEIGMYVMEPTLGWIEVDTSAAPLVYEPYINAHFFEFITWNFYGATIHSPQTSASIESVYWVDSQNKARYYNESEGVVVIDNAGMGVDDKPQHICAKGDYLWLSYAGGSLQFSTIGLPTDWATAPGEFGMGKEITAIQPGVGGSLMIFMINGISTLTGEVEADWVLKTFSRESGAYKGTAQRLLGTTFFMDDRGLTTLEAVDFFGDYAANSITDNFKKTFLKNKLNGTVSTINRELNQYRMYFNNGLGIVIAFQEKELQGTTFTLFPISVDVVTHGQLEGKQGITLFSSRVSTVDGEDVSGYVYLMDSGTNFDGAEIVTKATTAYYHYNTPRKWKRFISCIVESSLPAGLSLNFKIDYNYHSPILPTSNWISGTSGDVVSTTAIYSKSVYGEGIYGASPITNSQAMYLQGYGVNASYQWITKNKWAASHNIQNIISDYRVYRRMV